MLVMVLAGDNPLNLPLQVGIHHIPDLPSGACGHIDPQFSEEIDGSLPHTPGDHHICLLGVNELWYDPRLMIWKIRILDHLMSHDAIAIYIDKRVVGTLAEMGTDRSVKT
jgi:hypothetical protein